MSARPASGWPGLGAVAPGELVEARNELHHAAQLVAAVGQTLLPARDDDSQPNLGWDAATGSLAGHAVPGPRALRAALRPAPLELLLLEDAGGGAGSVALRLPLAGLRLDEALERLAAALRDRGLALPGAGLVRPPYDLPPHPVADGAALGGRPEAAFAELGRWFAGAAHVLEDLAARTPGASEVRCWPHHFDIATLIELERDASGEATKTIGAGLSPGDADYAEPYWYVTPWPVPEERDAGALPPLGAGGHWHTQTYLAAILTGSELLAGPASGQEARARAFLDAAVEACRRVHAPTAA